MPDQPSSSVDKFETGNADAEDTAEGTEYSDPDSAGEPAIMLSQGQADAAGMTGAMPGDKFQVTVTVATQNDDGWNVQLDPGSAVKMDAPDMAPEPPEMKDSMKPKGPGDFGMPAGLGASPSILNT
jgi:hypothetical protein